jgi:hypothetical protein
MEENKAQTTGLSDEKLIEAKKEVEAVLAKHNIILVPIVIHHGDRTISRIDIAPAPEQSEQN